MWFVVYVGLAILGFVLAYAVATLALMLLPVNPAVGLATFLALTATSVLAGVASSKQRRSGTPGAFGGFIGTFMGVLFSGAIDQAESDWVLAWWLGAAVLGMIAGVVLSLLLPDAGRKDPDVSSRPELDEFFTDARYRPADACPRCGGRCTEPGSNQFCKECGGTGKKQPWPI